MYCPFKLANSTLAPQWSPEQGCYNDVGDVSCDTADCALWNEHFGKCSLAVNAHLKEEGDIAIDFVKLDKAIEVALSAPSPNLALHHLIDKVIKSGPPGEKR